MIYNSDFKYDLQIGQNYETSLYELLGKKIEVKSFKENSIYFIKKLN